MKIDVVLRPCAEGGYTVFVPGLKGCISQGETHAEALENIREAIELYVELVNEEPLLPTDEIARIDV